MQTPEHYVEQVSATTGHARSATAPQHDKDALGRASDKVGDVLAGS
jgi:hypothetical protein